MIRTGEDLQGRTKRGVRGLDSVPWTRESTAHLLGLYVTGGFPSENQGLMQIFLSCLASEHNGTHRGPEPAYLS